MNTKTNFANDLFAKWYQASELMLAATKTQNEIKYGEHQAFRLTSLYGLLIPMVALFCGTNCDYAGGCIYCEKLFEDQMDSLVKELRRLGETLEHNRWGDLII